MRLKIRKWQEDTQVGFYSLEKFIKVCAKMKISTVAEYKKRYKEDPRLPSDPTKVYKFWTKWPFTSSRKQPSNCYNLDEFKTVCKKLEIKNEKDYCSRYKEDLKLPSNPYTFYINWPGWPSILHDKLGYRIYKGYYDFTEFITVCKNLRITTWVSYRKKRKLDSRLPPNPKCYYRENWVSWKQLV